MAEAEARAQRAETEAEAEVQRAEAQAEVQRTQRAEAQRAQRAEAQRAEAQRAQAQRAQMAEAEAQMAEAEAQRAQMLEVEARAQRAEIEALKAETRAQKAAAQKAQKVKTQKAQKAAAQKAAAQKAEETQSAQNVQEAKNRKRTYDSTETAETETNVAWNATEKVSQLIASATSGFKKRKEIYNNFMKITLPNKYDPVWQDTKLARVALQKYLFEKYKMDKPPVYLPSMCAQPNMTQFPANRWRSEKTSIACEMATLEPFQKAAVEPILVLDSLLVVADTGTGKSFAMAEIEMRLYTEYDMANNDTVCIVVIVQDKKQALNQFNEMQNSPAFHKMVCVNKKPLQEIVAMYDPTSKKSIRIVSYIQAGNLVKKGKIDENTIIIMDECHTLASPEEAGAHQESIRTFAAWLDKRKYKKLVGFTATPFVNIEAFAKLMTIFSGINEGIKASELEALIDHTEPSKDEITCGIKESRIAIMTPQNQIKLINQLNVRVLYYSADRDVHKFPKFHENDITKIEVYLEKKPDNVSVARKWTKNGTWTDRTLFHKSRQDRIVAAMVDPLLKQLKIGVKALVFTPTKSSAQLLYTLLKKKNENQYNFELLIVDATKSTSAITSHIKNTIDRYGDIISPNTPAQVLITDFSFATGYTFSNKGQGPRQLHTLQVKNGKSKTQMIGRTVRRCSHASYPVHDRTVEAFTYIPFVSYTKKDGLNIPKPMLDSTVEELHEIMKMLNAPNATLERFTRYLRTYSTMGHENCLVSFPDVHDMAAKTETEREKYIQKEVDLQCNLGRRFMDTQKVAYAHTPTGLITNNNKKAPSEKRKMICCKEKPPENIKYDRHRAKNILNLIVTKNQEEKDLYDLTLKRWQVKVGDQTSKMCEEIFSDVVNRDINLHETLMGALYMVSFGRDAFWERRPLFVDSIRSNHNEVRYTEWATRRLNAIMKAVV